MGNGGGRHVDDGFCSTEASEDKASAASSLSTDSTAAPTYSPMSSDDEMPNVECDVLNINEAVLLLPRSVPLILAQRSAEENDSGHAFGDRSEENRVQVMEVQTNEIRRPEGTPTTYKLVGDNLDLTVKARYMRIDGQKDQSLYYFHHMSVCDRIDLATCQSQEHIHV